MSKELPKSFLLDTHVWVGLINGDSKACSPKLIDIVKKYAPDTRLYVSVMSAWEVAMLEVKGKVLLPRGCEEWVSRALEAPNIVMAEVTSKIAVQSTRLPGKFHGDPVDRILIATAKNLDAVFVSRDKEIAAYCLEHELPYLS